MQNFPQDNNKCKIFPSKLSSLFLRTLEQIPWLRVRISAGRALKERQCTLKGQAWYVNVRGSVHWKGMYRVGQVHKFPHMGKFMRLIQKGRAPFHAIAKLKQTVQTKILMSQILIRKRAHQIVEHAYHQTAHLFMSQNDHHLGDAFDFDYVSSPPLPYTCKNYE